MRRLVCGLVLALGSIFLSGCFSAVRITQGPAVPGNPTSVAGDTRVPGIPFYAKKGVCKRESTWLQPVMILTFEATEISGQKKFGPWTKELSFSSFKGNKPIEKLRMALSQSGAFSGAGFSKILEQWQCVAKMTDYVPLSEKEKKLIGSDNAVLVSNTAAVETAVDYSRVYYYNARRPWIGSAQVNAALNTDGTLSQGSAQVESQTLSSFLGLVPSQTLASIIPFVAGRTRNEKEEQVKALLPAGTYRVELMIREEDYLHTHTEYGHDTRNCTPAEGGVKEHYALQIKLASGNAQKNEAGNSVDVTGKVKLSHPTK